MRVVETEERLINASIYIKNAMLELKNIHCKCSDTNYCSRCVLLEDTQNLRNLINEEILNLLNSN